MTVCASPVMIDVRAIAPLDRQPMILAAFNLLGTGDAMELTSGQDLMPAHLQLQSEVPGQFSWAVLTQGPAIWRVAVTRLATVRGHGGSSGCCGGCGG